MEAKGNNAPQRLAARVRGNVGGTHKRAANESVNRTANQQTNQQVRQGSHISLTATIEAFRSSMLTDLGAAPNVIEPDGQLHRFPTNGKQSDRAGYYGLYSDGVPGGYYGDYRQGIKCNWKYEGETGSILSAEERASIREKARQQHIERAAQRRYEQEQAAQQALIEWQRAKPASHDHPYLLKKMVQGHNARVLNDVLLIPVFDVGGRLWGLQHIYNDGRKYFLKSARKRGLFSLLNGKTKDLSNAKQAVACEGWATSATLAEMEPERLVVVAFDAGNLIHVAESLLSQWPDLKITIVGDDDRQTESETGRNPGKEKARAVAEKFPNVNVLFPTWPEGCPLEASDLNDLMVWKQRSALSGGVS